VKNLNIKTTLILALSLLIAPVLFFFNASAYNTQIDDRNIIISNAIPDSTNNSYRISFRHITPSILGSMEYDFCSNSPLIDDPCTIPTGLDLNIAATTIASQSGNTGFSVDLANSDSNTLLMTRAPSPNNLALSTYELQNITNPSLVNQTVYVRITTFASTDGSGLNNETGAVAFSMTPVFNVGAYVPPYMTFCVAQTVSVDCSSVNGFLLDFGEFNENTASTATLQFSTATNDLTGYNAFINGQTMTSGNNIIPALTTQTSSAPGNSQFGFNLIANSNPNVGAGRDGAGSGVADPNYAVANRFRFANGDRIASSPITTEFTRFTASYIVNIAANQAPGIYASTLSFTAVASF